MRLSHVQRSRRRAGVLLTPVGGDVFHLNVSPLTPKLREEKGNVRFAGLSGVCRGNGGLIFHRRLDAARGGKNEGQQQEEVKGLQWIYFIQDHLEFNDEDIVSESIYKH